VNAHALLGLLALNLWYLVVGILVLFALHGWASWAELGRFAGLGYMLGVASLATLWIFELAIGIPLGFPAIFVTGALIGACALLYGSWRGRRLVPATRPSWPAITWVGAIGAALTIVYLEAAFRAARLAGLYEFDAWDFWVPKAKAIYFLHGLDTQFFTSLPGPSYPPLLPALEASAMHFMGSPDVVTLHLQFWFVIVGFTAAVAGLLAPRVRPLLLGAPLLLALATPSISGRALQTQADLLLDELFALAALLIALWLLERESWQPIAATVLLAGTMVTKREGFLLSACVLAAALAASWPQLRRSVPVLVGVGVVAFVPSLAWRIWFERKGLPSDAPEAGGLGLLDHLDRAWPSLELTLRDLFGYDLWLVTAPVALLAVLAAVLAGRRMIAGYAGLLFAFGVVGFTWITWSFPSLPITENAALNPITRAVGALVLASAGLVPLLLASAWDERPSQGET
jgi:hypothetical protein